MSAQTRAMIEQARQYNQWLTDKLTETQIMLAESRVLADELRKTNDRLQKQLRAARLGA